MGQLGLQELIIIFIIALLVFGPKKLPELGKSLGKGLREFKKATDDLKSTWDDQMREVSDPLKETTREIQKDFRDSGHVVEPEHHSPPELIHQIAAGSHEESQPTDMAVPKEHV